MIKNVLNESIETSKADIVVVSTNGFGYLRSNNLPFSQKTLNDSNLDVCYSGLLEGLATGVCQAKGVFGYKAGNVFVTVAPFMDCKHVIHAVTRWLPFGKTKKKVLKKIAPKIVDAAYRQGAKTVAVPMLGLDNDNIEESEVYEIYKMAFEGSSIEFLVYGNS